MKEFEVIIIGGGPAGLTAGLYACRSRLHTLLLEKGSVGGQIALAERVENFPGFPQGISGIELAERILEQAKQFGLEVIFDEVKEVEPWGEVKVVKTDKEIFKTKVIIIASGLSPRPLRVKGEAELIGRGVSYCALCDAPLFRGQQVAVVGGGDAALTDALYLSKFTSQIFLIHRRKRLRATPILQERACSLPNIEFLWERVVEEIKGDNKVEGLTLRQVKTGEISFLPVNGVFIATGFEPSTPFLKDRLRLTPQGYIITNEKMETEIPGVFAAGDIRSTSAHQAITAAAEGAIAALSAYRYLREGI